MQPKVINPYAPADTKQKEALDFVITNLPPSPTFMQLNQTVLASIFGTDPNNPMNNEIITVFTTTVLPLGYNGYVSNGLNSNIIYDEKQQVIINHIITGIQQTTPESLVDFFTAAEEKIASSGLLYQQQLPLYIAAQAGKTQAEYWLAQTANPGSAWAAYFNTNPAVNYIHLSGWVSASVQGALLCYGIIKPEQLSVPDSFCAIIGSVGLAAGKVVFGWNEGI